MTRIELNNPNLRKHSKLLYTSDNDRLWFGSLHRAPASHKEQKTKFLGRARGAFIGQGGDSAVFV